MQTWKVIEITSVSSALNLGKVRLESKGPRDMQNSLCLYVSLENLKNYQIGSQFQSDLVPALVVTEETVSQ